MINRYLHWKQLQRQIILFFQYIAMQNQLNQRSEEVQNYNSIKFQAKQQDSINNLNPSDNQDANGLGQSFPEKDSMFSNNFNLIGEDSYHTINRGSLKIVPQSPSYDLNCKSHEGQTFTLKQQPNSFLFQQQDSQAERQRKLILKTEQLTLHSSFTSIVEGEDDEPRKHNKNGIKNNRYRVRNIKTAKHLIRQLKRQFKYNNCIKGDAIFTTTTASFNIKQAILNPIISQKGHLSGLIINYQTLQLKVRVVNKDKSYFDPILELWDNNQQNWIPFTFKIRLLNV